MDALIMVRSDLAGTTSEEFYQKLSSLRIGAVEIHEVGELTGPYCAMIRFSVRDRDLLARTEEIVQGLDGVDETILWELKRLKVNTPSEASPRSDSDPFDEGLGVGTRVSKPNIYPYAD